MYVFFFIQTPPITKKKDNPYGYGTLPKDRHKDEEKGKLRVFPTLGKTLLRMKTGKRSCSAPNLGEKTSNHASACPWFA